MCVYANTNESAEVILKLLDQGLAYNKYYIIK